MKRFALYCRVSTKDQSIDSQIIQLREFARQRGWKVVAEFSDVGISGSQEKRPQLDALMEMARKRKIDGLAVFRFDRFARSTTHLLKSLDEFRSLGIDFVSWSENIDSATSLGAAMFTIVAAVAQLEKDILKERVNAGINKARIQGKMLGRPKSVIDMDKVMDLRSKGKSIREIAGQFDVSKDTICRFLRLYQKSIPKPSPAS